MTTPLASPTSDNPTTRDPRWSQIVARDRAADGSFFYSVRTTGVYCRPSCGSRLANPANVRFHDDRVAAETAGFRPCKRCRPDRPTLDDEHAVLVARACKTIEAAETLPSLETLAAAAGLSRFHFQRVFKSIAGLTPRAYASAYRARRMQDSLARTNRVVDAIYDAGFGSSSRFYDGARAILGMNPAEYRKGGEGAVIRFAVGQCWLGAILVACSEIGICAILIDDDPDVLVRNLQDRFPKAHLIGADRQFEKIVARVVGFVEAPATGLGLPLDIRGTVFQRRVWKALIALPPGSTASYTEIAHAIGAPAAVRAVAQACAANALAVAIPCHRVVRTDGALSGYRWGIARKRALLDREREDNCRPGADPATA